MGTTLGKADALSGKVIGGGKYVLGENPQKSSSGKSQIYRGYRADANKQPVGSKLVVKISENPKTMSHENDMYNTVAKSQFSESFIKKVDFLPELKVAEPGFDQKCALVMECGQKDLGDILKERGGRGLEGKALRDAAKAAADCVQAMHSSGFVWTDLKPTNLVVVGDEIKDSNSALDVKGIDVEGANPCKSFAVSYSPEACPPEFARAIGEGKEDRFALDYSYDIWSYGLYLYELATGKAYFEAKNPGQVQFMGKEVVIEIMADPSFRVDVSDVQDSNLQNLIGQCLSIDPKKRPDISQVVAHPYFTGVTQ